MTEEEHDMVREMHDWLFKPPITGRPARAEQLDDVMSGVRAGKLTFRLALYVAGAVTAFGGAFATVKGWIPWR